MIQKSYTKQWKVEQKKNDGIISQPQLVCRILAKGTSNLPKPVPPEWRDEENSSWISMNPQKTWADFQDQCKSPNGRM